MNAADFFATDDCHDLPLDPVALDVVCRLEPDGTHLPDAGGTVRGDAIRAWLRERGAAPDP